MVLDMHCPRSIDILLRGAVVVGQDSSVHLKGCAMLVVVSKEHDCTSPMPGVSADFSSAHHCAGMPHQQQPGGTVRGRHSNCLVARNFATGDDDLGTITGPYNAAVYNRIVVQRIPGNFTAGQCEYHG